MMRGTRTVGIWSGPVVICEKWLPETRRRPAGLRYGVFVGGRQKGSWLASIEEAESEVATLRRMERPCLCCGRAFYSHGPHNRLCNACGQQSLPEHH